MKCLRRRIRLGRLGESRDPDDKKRARLNIITDLLSQIPYERQASAKIELPKRKTDGCVGSDYTSKLIPEAF